ncbi:hypothetical protein [Xanthomonas hortorum]|uniref:Secreted protein n=1 Tax=Xanthomonas hortorum pv. gardneri TaxID=2754056 RepID=A0A6V7EEF0_9XANT|nr:hypothetical protein [Xanthomonas hortorum]MCC4626588.1 hypothetical protein [Xanthomonas campestris pv. nigromaculans]APP79591.1 hypothetical protein BJD10_07645 [Xanthomonas hortorum pv. gardneri]EGD20086.1 hypothetical protein XGA_1232 [Xanthomonas hortorum ATCC 19865]KLA90759.1 hypothetical protein SM17710_22365 [Xanthomonas hortorum pv. gardneri]KLA96606.1 hypothetical protein SM19410_12560 [Xanthomonas hortorum pv. gardneri]
MSRLLSRCLSTILLLACLVSIGCVAAPPTDTATPPPETGSASGPATGQATGKPIVVTTTCRTDADCTVKDVGNCCGAFPACVNVNSATDPKGVLAQCQASGMMSVCGFREISACQCVAGQCAAKDAQADTLRPAPPSTETVH